MSRIYSMRRGFFRWKGLFCGFQPSYQGGVARRGGRAGCKITFT
jgi:hypothetical protein